MLFVHYDGIYSSTVEFHRENDMSGPVRRECVTVTTF